jgi:hypothetical protein
MQQSIQRRLPVLRKAHTSGNKNREQMRSFATAGFGCSRRGSQRFVAAIGPVNEKMLPERGKSRSVPARSGAPKYGSCFINFPCGFKLRRTA